MDEKTLTQKIKNYVELSNLIDSTRQRLENGELQLEEALKVIEDAANSNNS
jgi:exonuclease VII small subunit